MTKNELITRLEQVFPKHKDPDGAETITLSDGKPVKRYQVQVWKEGISSKYRDPIIGDQKIDFYVYDEGEADEAAWFGTTELLNKHDKDLVGSTLEVIGKIYSDTIMRQRVLGAVLKAAYDVVNEDGGTANHAERVVWAKSALLNPASYQNQMMGFVATNPTIQTNGGEATDNDIQYIVNSNIDTVAV